MEKSIEQLEIERFQLKEEDDKMATFMAINGLYEDEDENYYHG